MTIEYIKGDLFKSLKEKPNDLEVLVPHVVNNRGQMGSGFVVPLMGMFPKLKQEYIDVCNKRDFFQLGLGGLAYFHHDKSVSETIVVANMFAQNGTIREEGNTKPLKYHWLSKAMDYVGKRCHGNGIKPEIWAPKFGSGLSAGNWQIIEAIIEDCWVWNHELTVKVFEL
jgi:hypothetical protein